MTPADEMTTAAKKLRDLAAQTTLGPWQQTGIGDYGWTVCTPDSHVAETDDSGLGRADADWIATMNPRVGTALADWLDQAAHHYECGIRAADDVFHDDPAGRDAFLTTGPGAPSTHAIAVARAVLGSPDA